MSACLVSSVIGSYDREGLSFLESEKCRLTVKGRKVVIRSGTSHENKKAHQMLAWGVLGSASDGLPFLLTHPVVFRSI